MQAHPIDPIINPKTIAIIGASKDPGKRGFRAIKSLQGEGFTGTIYPINPKESEILGLKCYSKIAEVPCDAIDLAVILTPAATVPGVMEECGRKGVKGALVVAGGFSEASEAGAILEAEMLQQAKKYGIRVIGPNTNGIWTARNGVNTVGIKGAKRGPIAMIANSANVINAMAVETDRGGAGINMMLSVGTQADLAFDEYVASLATDPDVGAIASYVEGFKNGPAFLAAARKVAMTKPIAMYVVGRNAAGRSAAKSHSASFAGDYLVSQGVLSQAGVTLVARGDEIYPVAEALTVMPPMRGRRVALLSEGGGVITIASEALSDRKMVLPTLSAETQSKIHAVIPASTAISNPVDSGSGTDPRAEYCGAIARALIEDPNIDGILIVGVFGGYGIRMGEVAAKGESKVTESLVAMAKEFGKPIVVQSHYSEFQAEPLDIMRKGGIPVHRDIETAVQCLVSAADYHAARTRLIADAKENRAVPARAASAIQAIGRAQTEKRNLLETEARAVLQAYGVPVPAHVLMRTRDDATAVIRQFGDAPLALKIVSKDVIHKSESGGVKLNVSGLGAVKSAFDDIVANVRGHEPKAAIAGILATTMARNGTEFIMGVSEDPQYGRVIMFGLGGVFVEIIRDVVFRSVPITKSDAHEMVEGIRYQGMLNGQRGAQPANRGALADLLLKLSDIAAAHPEIAEIDLNPVIAGRDGNIVVDARMILREP